jgi:hypothetical protein
VSVPVTLQRQSRWRAVELRMQCSRNLNNLDESDLFQISAVTVPLVLVLSLFLEIQIVDLSV